MHKVDILLFARLAPVKRGVAVKADARIERISVRTFRQIAGRKHVSRYDVNLEK